MRQGKAEYMFMIVVLFAIGAMASSTYFHLEGDEDDEQISLSEHTALLLDLYKGGNRILTFTTFSAQHAACTTMKELQQHLAVPSCMRDGIPILSTSGQCAFHPSSVGKNLLPGFRQQFQPLLASAPYQYPTPLELSYADGEIKGIFPHELIIPSKNKPSSPVASLYTIHPDFQIPFPADLSALQLFLQELDLDHACIEQYNPLSSSSLEDSCTLFKGATYEKKGDDLLVTFPLGLANCIQDSVLIQFIYPLKESSPAP
ncbi:MAG: hypothetical protein AABX86_02420 [Nanoarchaeota archaeon]